MTLNKVPAAPADAAQTEALGRVMAQILGPARQVAGQIDQVMRTAPDEEFDTPVIVEPGQDA